MRIPEGYNEATAFTGEFETLDPGGYVCRIVAAKEDVTQKGQNRLNLLLEIAEGESAGFAQRKFDGDTRAEKKWPLVLRQITEWKSVSFFKGLITSIEESNPGYKWNWDENTLKGKLIGALFGREEYIGNDGTPKLTTKPVSARSVSAIRNKDFKVPEDKLMSSGNAVGYTPQDYQPLDQSDGDLPF